MDHPHVSTPPHVMAKPSVHSIMRDMLIALLPPALVGIYLFGQPALAVMAVSVLAAVCGEFLYQTICKKPRTVSDLSAAVTGMILALSLPPNIPLWIPALGSLFAMIIVKQLFGGLGHNFMNPALTARAVLLASWPVQMSAALAQPVRLIGTAALDGVSSATALDMIKLGNGPFPSPLNLFLGNMAGCIGEVGKLAILLGMIYLLARRVIRIHIPAAFVLSSGAALFALGGFQMDSAFVTHMLSGGMLFSAVYMATDYTTCPMTVKGQIVYGIGGGILLAVVRRFGAYPEGATYAILLMNIVTPLIDRFIKPRVYGRVKTHA